VQGEVSGRWQQPETVAFQGRVAATNFTFRGETCSRLEGQLAFSNAVLRFSDLLVQHEEQSIRAPAGSFDLAKRVVDVTNAVSTMDPSLVTRVIGPKVHAAIRPYRFRTPPTVRVNGRLPTTRIQDANVRFEVAGEGFSYWRLQLPSVLGDVFWRGDFVSITNVEAGFYGGDLAWHGDFDFSGPPGAQLSFRGRIRKANFHELMVDLGKKANQLHGSLDADVEITSARSDDWRSWQGHGKVRLRDGFLWDIPIFGFFSPVLNGILPGLGHSPISSGRATFTMDESVVRTSNLELRSPALRLQYAGSVDLQGAVEARMRAEILRDAWGVGRAVSLALWPISKAFEYKMTGTVFQPKTEPLFIPKALLWPLHPFRTLKGLLGPKHTPAVRPEPPPAPFWEDD
jgi:hypothetical protein